MSSTVNPLSLVWNFSGTASSLSPWASYQSFGARKYSREQIQQLTNSNKNNPEHKNQKKKKKERKKRKKRKNKDKNVQP